MKKIGKLIFLTISITLIHFSCSSNPKQKNESEAADIKSKVDKEAALLKSSIREFNFVLAIDHSRLAEEAGVYTPPSIVTLFSNSRVNSELISKNPLTGLDLPYKVLCYSEPDTLNASIAVTSSTFLRKRHGLTEEDLQAFDNDIKKVLGNFSESQIVPTNYEKVIKNYGIIQLNSNYDFETTIQRLKNVVNAQSDTKWFGEINFQEDAKALNIAIGKTSLLLFGGPAPGGKAMFDSPKLGLDAFCQKLLVFENDSNQVIVAFNDIPAFAELYYNRSTKPQEMINQRLKTAFENALSNN
jgi:uncharacterized protein (DUF302 family)